MKIAIIGAGFSGLATAWHLLRDRTAGSIKLTIFDSKGIGGGASGIAAGLMHPYAGAHAKLNKFGLEGMAIAKQLFDVASNALGQPVANQSGLLRIALSHEQENDYSIAASKYQDVTWLEASQCQEIIPDTPFKPGIFIKNAYTVDCQLYLNGLWNACKNKGASLEIAEIKNLESLKEYDIKVLAAGAKINSLLSNQKLPITPVKGQLLEIEWPKNISPLKHPLNSQAYLIMNPDKQACILGATFERNFESDQPEMKVAKEYLLPKLSMYPLLENAPILSIRAGLRASTPDHMPKIKKINENCWAITGMGSKGLLYHGLYAERLCQEISLFFLALRSTGSQMVFFSSTSLLFWGLNIYMSKTELEVPVWMLLFHACSNCFPFSETLHSYSSPRSSLVSIFTCTSFPGNCFDTVSFRASSSGKPKGNSSKSTPKYSVLGLWANSGSKRTVVVCPLFSSLPTLAHFVGSVGR